MEDQKKEISGITVGFNVGMFTLLYSWLLLFIPAILLQNILDLHVDDELYILLLTPFQIGCAFLGNKFAIKSSTKNKIISENPLKTIIVSVITTSILVFIIEIVIGTGTLVPFKNILGFILLLITYIISNIVFKKNFS